MKKHYTTKIRLYYCGIDDDGNELDGCEGELHISKDEYDRLKNILKDCRGIHIQDEKEDLDYCVAKFD